MIRKLLCLCGRHECDLWIAGWMKDLIAHINAEADKDWGWLKVSYDKFGLAYYLECKHCNKKLN